MQGSTDGAAAMQGSTDGVVRKIKNVFLDCVSTYCLIHRKTLVVEKIEQSTVRSTDCF